MSALEIELLAKVQEQKARAMADAVAKIASRGDEVWVVNADTARIIIRIAELTASHVPATEAAHKVASLDALGEDLAGDVESGAISRDDAIKNVEEYEMIQLREWIAEHQVVAWQKAVDDLSRFVAVP